MKKLPRNRFTDLNQIRKFGPDRLAIFLRQFKGLNLDIPNNPTDKNMPYDAIRRACVRLTEETPPEFLVATHLVSASSTPSQRRRVEELAARKNITLGIPENVSDHDFAILVWLEHPSLLEMALYYATMMRQRKYAYYPPAAPLAAAPRLPADPALRIIESELDRVLGNKGYGIGARILVEDTPYETWLLIRRGERLARVAAVADDGESEIHVLRPENYDVVILNKRRKILKVLSKPDNQGLHAYYRMYFGELFFGALDAFAERKCIHIDCFKTADRSIIAPTDRTEINHAALTGVCFNLPGAGKRNRRYKSPDIFGDLQPGELAIPEIGTPVDVTTRLQFVDDGSSVDVKIFAGNLATFSREGASYAVDDWMIDVGILRLQDTAEDAQAA